MPEPQLIRVKISGQHYTLLAEVIDSANGVVRIVDSPRSRSPRSSNGEASTYISHQSSKRS